jgi:hypothetical protein
MLQQAWLFSPLPSRTPRVVTARQKGEQMMLETLLRGLVTRNAPDSLASASFSIPGNAASTWHRPLRSVIPRSSSKPRIWLMTAVRRITQRSRSYAIKDQIFV